MRWIKLAERQLFGARKYNRSYHITTIFEHMKLLRVSFMYRWKVMKVKTEVDDVTTCPHDDQSTTGVLGLYS